eukprot:scaffold31454_cov40-Phaeocystis_antarctica.AAC.3
MQLHVHTRTLDVPWAGRRAERPPLRAPSVPASHLACSLAVSPRPRKAYRAYAVRMQCECCAHAVHMRATRRATRRAHAVRMPCACRAHAHARAHVHAVWLPCGCLPPSTSTATW